MTEAGTQTQGPLAPTTVLELANRHVRASVRLSLGSSRLQADAQISPLGLLAIGGMVGAILPVVAPIVRAGTRSRRRF
jgi:hypothetical protein